MPTYTVHDAKTNLSKLIERAEAGEEGIIARRDTPAVRLVPVAAQTAKRRFGAYAGQASIDDAFFDPLPAAELDAWDGGQAAGGKAKARRKSPRA